MHPTPTQQLHDDRNKFCDACAIIRTNSQKQSKRLCWTGHFEQISCNIQTPPWDARDATNVPHLSQFASTGVHNIHLLHEPRLKIQSYEILRKIYRFLSVLVVFVSALTTSFSACLVSKTKL